MIEVTAPPALQTSPMKRRLATLFVDIAGSTSLLVHHPPEVVLGVVQGFMTLVTEMASAHAGTVKDFEGDGALVYFASVYVVPPARTASATAAAAGCSYPDADRRV